MSFTEDELRQRLSRLAEFAETEPRTVAQASSPAVALPSRKPALAAVVLGAAAVVLVAAVAVASHHPHSTRVVIGSPTLNRPGSIVRLPDSPLSGRADIASAWTGHEWLIWGGSNIGNRYFSDGAAYDPQTGRWKLLPAAPIAGRAEPGSVWTGKEWIIWGGNGRGGPLADGAAYDPSTGHWRVIASAPFATLRAPALWTGRELLIAGRNWVAEGPGGEGQTGPLQAAAYDPSSDRWRALSSPPGDMALPMPQAVWTGSQAFFLQADEGLAAYEPATDKWSRLPDAGITKGTDPPLVWTGAEVLVLDLDGTSKAYNPRVGAWRTLGGAPKISGPPFNPIASIARTPPVWTGTTALLWAGGRVGLAYDPGQDRWSTFNAGGLRSREIAATAWTGKQLLGWGGFVSTPGNESSANDGIAYTPPLPALIKGHFQLVGGPVSGRVLPVAGTVEVHLVALDGRVVATGGSAEDGSFQISVTPGQYVLRGLSPHVSGVECLSQPLTVTAGMTAEADVDCHIP